MHIPTIGPLRMAAISLILATVFVSSAVAKTHYVETWGNDANDPCSKTTPCESIAGALALAGTNDRIVVGPGTYDENLDIDIQGLKLESSAGRHATVIRALSSFDHVIDVTAQKVRIGKKGKGFTLYGATDSSVAAIRVFTAEEPGNIRIEGNRLGYPRGVGALSTPENETGLTVGSGGERIQIRNNIFVGNSTALYCQSTCAKGVIKDNRFSANGFSIRTTSAGPLQLIGNVISRSGLYGMDLVPNGDGIRVSDNVVEYSGANGIQTDDFNNSRLEKNITFGNGDNGIRLSLSGGTDEAGRLDRNLAADNVSSGLLVEKEGPGEFDIETRIDQNTASNNGVDGITLSGLLSVGSLKGNNTHSNDDCGVTLAPAAGFGIEKHFSANETQNPIDCDIDGTLATKPGSLKVNGAQKAVGG